MLPCVGCNVRTSCADGGRIFTGVHIANEYSWQLFIFANIFPDRLDAVTMNSK
jgi:hypothetical protein